MKTPAWQLHQNRACLQIEGLSARLEIAQPDRGLFDLRVGPRQFHDAQLLGLSFPSLAEAGPGASPECFVRGRDLVAAYAESASWPVQVDILWRAISPVEAAGMMAGVDMIVSVRTPLLDSWPELAVRSRLAGTEALRLAAVEAARFEPCGDVRPQVVLDAASGPCCLVFRMPDSPSSYAEMTHPADFRGSTLALSPDNPTSIEVRHRLFAERLEKGVIRRARVRGVFVDRRGDLDNARACYAAFAVADPPVGT